MSRWSLFLFLWNYSKVDVLLKIFESIVRTKWRNNEHHSYEYPLAKTTRWGHNVCPETFWISMNCILSEKKSDNIFKSHPATFGKYFLAVIDSYLRLERWNFSKKYKHCPLKINECMKLHMELCLFAFVEGKSNKFWKIVECYTMKRIARSINEENVNKEKGESLSNEIMFAAIIQSQRNVYISSRCLDFVDLCPFILISSQDEINNYRSVIIVWSLIRCLSRQINFYFIHSILNINKLYC